MLYCNCSKEGAINRAVIHRKGGNLVKTLIVAKQVEVTKDLKEIIEKKLSKFDKFFDTNSEACVTLSRKRGKEILEVTISVNSMLLRAEEEAETFRNALDVAIDVLERQIRKHKTKLQKRLRSGTFDKGIYDLPAEDEEDTFKVRTKKFAIRPMSVDEAILEMNLLDHEFFVFLNDETNTTNVVYKRKSGDYGLIIPTID